MAYLIQITHKIMTSSACVKDLANEYGCQGVAFSAGLGFIEMMDAESASPENLLKMAKQEEFDLEKYRK